MRSAKMISFVLCELVRSTLLSGKIMASSNSFDETIESANSSMEVENDNDVNLGASTSSFRPKMSF